MARIIVGRKYVHEDFSRLLRKHNENLKCSHELFIYCGSFDKDGKLVSDETNTLFAYNKYKCLNCGIELSKNEWEDFEENNYVYKNLIQDYKKNYDMIHGNFNTYLEDTSESIDNAFDYFKSIYYHNTLNKALNCKKDIGSEDKVLKIGARRK